MRLRLTLFGSYSPRTLARMELYGLHKRMPRNYTEVYYEYFNDCVRIDCNHDYLLDPEDDPFGEEEKVIVMASEYHVDDRDSYHHVEDRSFITSTDKVQSLVGQIAEPWEPYWVKRIKRQKIKISH